MSRWIVALPVVVLPLAMLAGAAARADENILGVLARSQQVRMDRSTAADPAGARAQTVRASFEALTRQLGTAPPVELRVVEGETVAETLQGRVILANVSLAEMSEGERLFILAHELGHVELHHWAQTERLYQKWVPGAVTPEQTEPVAALLGRDASGLSHAQEFEADAFALRTLQALGHSAQDARAAFMQMGANKDTPTHPATNKRLAALRAIEAEAAAAQATPLNNFRQAD